MQQQTHHNLAAALGVTERMLAAGQAQDWSRVVELEPERRKLLTRVFANGEAMDTQAAARVENILELDRQLMDLGRQARDAVARELGQVQRGAKATRAYRNIG